MAAPIRWAINEFAPYRGLFNCELETLCRTDINCIEYEVFEEERRTVQEKYEKAQAMITWEEDILEEHLSAMHTRYQRSLGKEKEKCGA